jgi:hypothetical protein
MMKMQDENLTIEEPVNDVCLAGPQGEIDQLFLSFFSFLLIIININLFLIACRILNQESLTETTLL